MVALRLVRALPHTTAAVTMFNGGIKVSTGSTAYNRSRSNV